MKTRIPPYHQQHGVVKSYLAPKKINWAFMGLQFGPFQKKSKRWGIEDKLSEKILTIFRFVTLPLKNKLSPMEILKNCVTPPGNSKVKK